MRFCLVIISPVSYTHLDVYKRQHWVSPRKQRKMERLERELSAYDDAGAMYQAQGSNAFTRSFRQTLTRDDKIKANIERKNRLTQELNRLRGEQNGHY